MCVYSCVSVCVYLCVVVFVCVHARVRSVCVCCVNALKERVYLSASVGGVCLGMCVCVFARLFSHFNS